MIENQVSDWRHLDVDQFYIITVLGSIGVEFERLEPFIHYLALQPIVVAIMQGRQLQCQGTIAAQCLDVGGTVGLGVGHPIRCLRTLRGSDTIEERDTGLLISRGARVHHMSVHRGAELQLAT